ncbi:MAG: potassium channel protein [Planctomycetota bacterium]
MPQTRRIVLALVLLTAVGMVGFSWIEGWPLVDGLYMAVITLTTVGYNEVHQLSGGGRIFTMIYLVVGLGMFMYGAVSLGEFVVRAQLSDWLGRKKMRAAIDHMENHFIVCGLGRFGLRLCEELEQRGLPFVAIESDPDVAASCKVRGWQFVTGDATADEALMEAGIDRAKGLACTLPSDAENMFVVLSARLMRKDLLILSRATTDKDAAKLKRAGANKVISLYTTGAVKMVHLLAKPNVEDFFEVVTAKGKSFELAEVKVTDGSSWAGTTLVKSGLRDKGVMVVGIRRASGDLLMPPGPNDEIRKGDCLIALGKVEAIQKLLA